MPAQAQVTNNQGIIVSSMPTIMIMSKRPHPRTSTSLSKHVRTKFFHRIGILHPMNKAPNVSVAERSVRDLRNVPLLSEPLQYSYNHNDEMEDQEPHQQQKQKKRVGFDETVTVVPIPMRCEYSDRIKTKLWSGNSKIRETVVRNLAEFAAEDYNWRGACQEEEMYICDDTRELIHPVHLDMGHYTFGTGGSCRPSY